MQLQDFKGENCINFVFTITGHLVSFEICCVCYVQHTYKFINSKLILR